MFIRLLINFVYSIFFLFKLSSIDSAAIFQLARMPKENEKKNFKVFI